MNRRDFNRTAAAALAGLALPRPSPGLASPLLRGSQSADLRVDGGRLNAGLAQLKRFGANDAGGIDRVAFSDANIEARAWVMDLMRGTGLDVHVDLVGNILGRRSGTDGEREEQKKAAHT